MSALSETQIVGFLTHRLKCKFKIPPDAPKTESGLNDNDGQVNSLVNTSWFVPVRRLLRKSK